MDQNLYTTEGPSPSTEPAPAPVLPLPKPLSAKETRRQFSRLGLSMLVLSAVMILAQTGVDILLAYTIPGYGTAWWRTWVLSLVPLYGFGLPFMFLSLQGLEPALHNTDYIHPTTGAREKKTRFSVGSWLILLVIGFGCMYVGSFVGNFIMLMMEVITGYPYEDQLGAIINESPLWMTLIGTCVCAPFGEELLFRKLLIDRSRRFGDTVSILLSGFFFGLFHGNLFQFFYAFLLGMILAYIYTRTGSYLLCVLMHAVINLMGSIVMPAIYELVPTATTVIPEEISLSGTLASLFVSLWTWGTIIGGGVLLLIFFRRRQLSRGTSPLYRRTAPYEVMLNPGMLANFIVMCVLMVMALIPQF